MKSKKIHIRAFLKRHICLKGWTRIALMSKNHVVKIPNVLGNRQTQDSAYVLFLCGLIKNVRQSKTSKCNKLVENKLCPVTFACPGGLFLIMKRATPMNEDQFMNLDYYAFVSGNSYKIQCEKKCNSFGYYGGKPVVVDYYGVKFENVKVIMPEMK